MKITQVELFSIYTPREYGYVSGHQVVRVKGEDDFSGLGEISDHRLPEREQVEGTLNRLLGGREAEDILPINEMLLAEQLRRGDPGSDPVKGWRKS